MELINTVGKEKVIWVDGNAFIVKKSLERTKNVFVRSLKKDGVISPLIPLDLVRNMFAHVETIVLNLYLTWIIKIVILLRMSAINAAII